MEQEKIIWCAFCGKRSGFVKHFISSPVVQDVNICNECVNVFKTWVDKAEADAKAKQEVVTDAEVVTTEDVPPEQFLSE